MHVPSPSRAPSCLRVPSPSNAIFDPSTRSRRNQCRVATLAMLLAPVWLVPAALATPPNGLIPACAPPHGCGKAAAAMRWLTAEPEERDPAILARLREAAGDTDMLHYNLEIEIFPSTGALSGTNTMTVQSLVDGLTEFTFRLRSNYTITSATIGGTPISVSTDSITTRTATLDRTYNTGETFDLTIAYNGNPVSVGFGSINYQSLGGQDLVFTLSEPYYSYSWWPCKDGDYAEPGDNSDKATVDIAIIAPDNMRSVSNGTLQGIDTLSGNRARYRWSSNYPIATYLVCFSSTDYNTWTLTYDYGSGTMPVEFNIFPGDDTTQNRNAWGKCVQMLATFEPLYGLYPFVDDKYGLYEFTFGGGMEHQTNTGQGGFWESVTAHELSHQWWGDNVTCRTWHDIWLNEGFATYGEALWAEYKPGSSGLPALFSAMDDRRPSAVDDSVYVYDTSDPGRIFDGTFTYDKGGWALHQLRHVVGDTTFFDILAAYRAAYQGGAATTDDFAAVASGVFGQDLSWFFDEWVYGIGAPSYDYGWQTEQINGKNYLRLELSQTQNSGYGVFTMPVDVRVDTAGGSETHTVWNDEEDEHFVVPISAAATGVAIDEFNWILTENKSHVAYTNGPPKLVATSPEPGDRVEQSLAPSACTINFSENVSVASGDFSVVGATTGAAAFTFSYTVSDYAATLDFGGPLPPDTYTVTVADTVTSTAASIALDGEMSAPDDPAALPSGEGLAGGSAVFTFEVAPPCNADVTGDGQINIADLGVVLANFGAANAQPEDGDVNGDGNVNIADLGELLAAFGTQCN